MVAQSGRFVVPGVRDTSIDEILAGDDDREPRLIEYVLRFEMRPEAMLSLYRTNAANSSLFPDLDRLARSVAYELEIRWARSID